MFFLGVFDGSWQIKSTLNVQCELIWSKYSPHFDCFDFKCHIWWWPFKTVHHSKKCFGCTKWSSHMMWCHLYSIFLLVFFSNMENEIQFFIRSFERLQNYGDAVNFSYMQIQDLTDVEKLRYGCNDQYCVYLNRVNKMAVLAQCSRYESEWSPVLDRSLSCIAWNWAHFVLFYSDAIQTWANSATFGKTFFRCSKRWKSSTGYYHEKCYHWFLRNQPDKRNAEWLSWFYGCCNLG